MRRGLREPLFWLVARGMAPRRRYATRLCVILCAGRCARGWAVVLIHGGGAGGRGAEQRRGGLGHLVSLLRLTRAHFVERERKPLGPIAASPRDMPAQLANESFRADRVRFCNSVGAVMQVLMRSDIPAAEAFFRDHLRVVPTGQKFSAANCGRV
jgi:hypothetical protein